MIIQDFYATIISQNAVSKCSKSCSYIHAQYEQKPKREFFEMIHAISIRLLTILCLWETAMPILKEICRT